MSKLKILKNSSIYLGSSVINKAIPFLLLPVMTTYLSPEDYGSLSLFSTLVLFSSALVGMAIHTNVSKYYYSVSKEILAIYIGNVLMILSGSFLFYFSLVLLLSLFYNQLFSIPIQWIIAIPAISLFMMVNNINTTILRNEGRAKLYGLYEISVTFVNMAVTIFLLVVMSFGWYSQAFGILISYFLFFTIGLFYMYKRSYINIVPDKEKLRSILKISIPLVPHIVGAAVLNLSDRMFIERMVSLKEVGIYSVGYMFGMVVMLFSDAFIKAWSPWFYKSLTTPTEAVKKSIVKYSLLYIAAIFLLAIFISFLGKMILPYFVEEEFYGASKYIFWIAIGYAVFGVYQIFFPYLVHINRTSFLAFSTTLAAILNLLFNYFFIGYFGTIGAAYATVAAFTVSASLVFFYTSKKYPMPWFKS
ncbi:polysaccharide biosynthesis C-terminal domain-containing protein [Salinimicrobium catena]|uniref:oligosaccharide flippase family protein n=1 Tax=Salinimicrobium catena TaxID=390640 RepID=UPI002FE4B548